MVSSEADQHPGRALLSPLCHRSRSYALRHSTSVQRCVSLHAKYCVKALFPPKVLTDGTASGLYFHKLGIHAAEDTSTTSGYTRLVDNDQCQFKDLQAATAQCYHASTGHCCKQLVEAIQVRLSTQPLSFRVYIEWTFEKSFISICSLYPF